MRPSAKRPAGGLTEKGSSPPRCVSLSVEVSPGPLRKEVLLVRAQAMDCALGEPRGLRTPRTTRSLGMRSNAQSRCEKRQ